MYDDRDSCQHYTRRSDPRLFPPASAGGSGGDGPMTVCYIFLRFVARSLLCVWVCFSLRRSISFARPEPCSDSPTELRQLSSDNSDRLRQTPTVVLRQTPTELRQLSTPVGQFRRSSYVLVSSDNSDNSDSSDRAPTAPTTPTEFQQL